MPEEEMKQDRIRRSGMDERLKDRETEASVS